MSAEPPIAGSKTFKKAWLPLPVCLPVDRVA